MRTYAEYLSTLTVKTLTAIAKQAGIKGYSRLRKAGLVMVIDVAATTAHAAATPVILDTENPADHDTIAALIAEVATEVPATPAESVPTVAFSAAPSPTMARPVTVPQTPAEVVSLDDLKDAYRNMRRTVNNMGARTPEAHKRRARYVGMLRNLSAQLKSAGIKHPQYL